MKANIQHPTFDIENPMWGVKHRVYAGYADSSLNTELKKFNHGLHGWHGWGGIELARGTEEV
jgi:hypothetical protein